MEKKVGTRVHVFSPDKKEDWGLGTITKIEPLDIEEEDGTVWRLLDNYTAEITLDDGRKTEGMECWWCEEE